MTECCLTTTACAYESIGFSFGDCQGNIVNDCPFIIAKGDVFKGDFTLKSFHFNGVFFVLFNGCHHDVVEALKSRNPVLKLLKEGD